MRTHVVKEDGMQKASRDVRQSIRVGTKVRVVGFKTPSKFDHPKYASDERGHIEGFAGKTGAVESVDGDAAHPYTVFFGENVLPRRCRFSAAELQLVSTV